MKNNFFLISLLCLISTSCSKKTTIPGIGKQNIDVSVDSNCAYGITKFNKVVTENLIRDIIHANKVQSNNLEDLKVLYPKTRAVWNRALNGIASNYSANWTSASINLDDEGAYTNHFDQNRKDFFEILTEIVHGPPPSNRHDSMGLAGWKQQASMKTRLDGAVRALLKSNCHGNDSGTIRRLLKPLLLPEKFEDCLEFKFDN